MRLLARFAFLTLLTSFLMPARAESQRLVFQLTPARTSSYLVPVSTRETTVAGPRVPTEWESRLERVRDTPAEIPFLVQTIREGAGESSTAIRMLGRKRTDAAAVAPELMRLSDSLSTDSRAQLISTVGRIDIAPETRLDFLLDRIDDPDPSVGSAALVAACRILVNPAVNYRRDEVIDRLIYQLDDENQESRSNAVHCLQNVRATAAIPSLYRVASEDPSQQVRQSAKFAVDVMEGRSSCTCAQPVKVLP